MVIVAETLTKNSGCLSNDKRVDCPNTSHRVGGQEYSSEAVPNYVKLTWDYKLSELDNFTAQILANLNNNPATCLDIGCGAGRDVGELKEKLGPKSTVYGVDLSDKMLLEGKKIDPNNLFFQADMINLPFRSNSMDAVMSIGVVQHLSESAVFKFFEQVFSVLKPGGIALIKTKVAPLNTTLSTKTDHYFIDQERSFNLFSPSFLISALNAAGLILINEVENDDEIRAQYKDDPEIRWASFYIKKPA